LRRAITTLQSCFRLKGKDHVLKLEDIYEISGVLQPDQIESLFAACRTGNYDKVDGYVEDLIRQGFPAAKVLDQCFNNTLESTELTDVQKAKIFSKISECNYRLFDGASEYLQLMDLGATIMRLLA